MKKDVNKIIESLEPVISKFVDELVDKIFLALEDVFEDLEDNKGD